jgi:hypothetical protein
MRRGRIRDLRGEYPLLSALVSGSQPLAIFSIMSECAPTNILPRHRSS